MRGLQNIHCFWLALIGYFVFFFFNSIYHELDFQLKEQTQKKGVEISAEETGPSIKVSVMVESEGSLLEE